MDWKEQLENCECTGMQCNHETSEKHYIIDADFLPQIIEKLINDAYELNNQSYICGDNADQQLKDKWL